MCMLSHSVRLSCKKMLQRLVFQVFCPTPFMTFTAVPLCLAPFGATIFAHAQPLWYLLLVVQQHWSDHCALLSLSVVSDSLWPQWTVARQAPLSLKFSRQEDWNGFPCPPPGGLPNSGIEPMSPALQADSLPLSHKGSPLGSQGTKMSLPFVVDWIRDPEMSFSKSPGPKNVLFYIIKENL